MIKAALSVSFPYLNYTPEWLKCNRSGNAWGFDKGVLVEFASNTPRLNRGVGLIVEESRTNYMVACRDFTDSVWTKTNCSAALNATGLDSVVNTATTLTASAANAVAKQQHTASSAAYTISVYLKLKPGATAPGDVYLSADETTWQWCGPLSETDWQRFSLTQTVANPKVAIKISNNSGVLQVDAAQLEAGSFATSPIITTTSGSTVTRKADEVYIDITQTARTNWFNAAAGTWVMDVLSSKVSGAQTFLYLRNQAGTGDYLQMGSDFSSTRGRWECGYTQSQYYELIDDDIVTADIPTIDGKLATSYTSGLQLFSVYGFRPSLPAADETNTINFSNVDALWLGNKDTTQHMSGLIRSVVYYNTQLNQQQLNELTQ